ncbi:MAG: hypothetical protein AMJ75_03995, partial [Phycisphaerae bacterium SM1_79]
MCRKLIYLTSFVLVLALASSVSASLVGYWALDEGSGTTAQDSSGNNNHGALMGDPQWVAGQVGGALQFDGVDDWVEVPHHDSLTVDSEVTVAAWIYAERHTGPGGATWQGVFAKGNTNRSYSLYTEASGALHFSTAGIGTLSDPTLPLNEWVHVCAMVAGGAHRYYVNGAPAGQGGSGIILPGASDTESVMIGTTHEGSREFLGMIDEVRVYDHALTEAEVEQLAFRPKAYNPTPADGATGVTLPMLDWDPGDSAKFHDVYLGTNPTPGPAELIAAKWMLDMYWFGAPGPGLDPGTTYYWKIDEVEVDGVTTHPGDVWHFTAASYTASEPSPADG